MRMMTRGIMSARATWLSALFMLATALLVSLVRAGPAPALPAATTGAPGVALPAEASDAGLPMAEVFFIQRNPSTDEVEWIGSAIIWVLLVLSAVSLSLIVMLARDTRRGAILPAGLAERVRDLLRHDRPADAARLMQHDESLLARALIAGLSDREQGRAAAQRAADLRAESLSLSAFRRIEPLGVIGNVAPMIGLFGTVYGIILAFRAIVASAGAPDPISLAAGIGTALVTTFWGLVVAIPALAAHSILRGRVEALTLEAAALAENLLAELSGEAAAPVEQPSRAPAAAAV